MSTRPRLASASGRVLTRAWQARLGAAALAAFVAPAFAADGSSPAATDGCAALTPYRGEPLETLPDASPKASEPVAVGEVRLHRLPVFDLDDPDQQYRVYRAANALRDRFGLATRPWVIEQTLLFRPQETVESRVIAESERHLRNQLYLYDARILPAQRCGDRIDYDVVTRDLWTLGPRLDINRSGGFSNFGIGIADANILGTGKFLTFGYRKNVDRGAYDLSYADPNIRGTRHTFGATVADSRDGYLHAVRVGRPFFSFDTHFAWGLTLERARREDSLYFRSDRFARFRRESELLNAFIGYSPGYVRGYQPRFRVGYIHNANRFEVIPGETAPAPFPDDIVLRYPFVAFELVEDDFAVTRNLDHLQRTEDLFVGRRIAATLGYSSAGPDRYVFRFDFGDGNRYADRTWIRFFTSAEGTWRTDLDEPENLEVRATLRVRDAQSEHFSLYGIATANWTDNLTEERQVLLGGDTGLRGYPLRYQQGDRRFVVSVEERWFSDLYLAKILRVGAAAFVDVGRAWFPDDPSDGEFGVLGDVGIGLRLESTRTQNGSLIHFDLAFPLVDGEDVDAVQFLVSIRQSL